MIDQPVTNSAEGQKSGTDEGVAYRATTEDLELTHPCREAAGAGGAGGRETPR